MLCGVWHSVLNLLHWSFTGDTLLILSEFFFTGSCGPVDSWILLLKCCYNLKQAWRLREIGKKWGLILMQHNSNCNQLAYVQPNFKITRWPLEEKDKNERWCDLNFELAFDFTLLCDLERNTYLWLMPDLLCHFMLSSYVMLWYILIRVMPWSDQLGKICRKFQVQVPAQCST